LIAATAIATIAITAAAPGHLLDGDRPPLRILGLGVQGLVKLVGQPQTEQVQHQDGVTHDKGPFHERGLGIGA
jgi:hypothetical protein